MRSLVDLDHVLDSGLADIRRQYQVPAAFPEAVVAAATEAARRPLHNHTDLTK